MVALLLFFFDWNVNGVSERREGQRRRQSVFFTSERDRPKDGRERRFSLRNDRWGITRKISIQIDSSGVLCCCGLVSRRAAAWCFYFVDRKPSYRLTEICIKEPREIFVVNQKYCCDRRKVKWSFCVIVGKWNWNHIYNRRSSSNRDEKWITLWVIVEEKGKWGWNMPEFEWFWLGTRWFIRTCVTHWTASVWIWTWLWIPNEKMLDSSHSRDDWSSLKTNDSLLMIFRIHIVPYGRWGFAFVALMIFFSDVFLWLTSQTRSGDHFPEATFIMLCFYECGGQFNAIV